MLRSVRSLLLLTLAAVTPADAADWPGWRGPHHDGTTHDRSALGGEHLALERVWHRPLGSGYSGISVAGARPVTLFAEGDADWLVALDTATGDERWRVRMGDRYLGHNGSEDGPSSTPVIGGDTVYALGASGRLVAVGLADGGLRWERRLDAAFGGTPSAFGFATTPLVVDDLLVVGAGGTAGAFAAFDRASGELRWRVGDDGIEYQSPVLARLAGRPTVLALGNDLLLGLDPASGHERFRLDYGPRPRYSTTAVVPVDGDRLLLNPWQETALFRVTRDGEAWDVAELWRETTLDARLATSVWFADHPTASTASSSVAWTVSPVRPCGNHAPRAAAV